MSKSMAELLYNEVCSRFPEVKSEDLEGNQDLPYIVMGAIVGWLKRLKEGELTPDITKRVISFSEWCFSQESGKTAGDDILTIWKVSFFEDLFNAEITRKLIPKLMTKEDLLHDKDYLIPWVGIENFETVLKDFKS